MLCCAGGGACCSRGVGACSPSVIVPGAAALHPFIRARVHVLKLRSGACDLPEVFVSLGLLFNVPAGLCCCSMGCRHLGRVPMQGTRVHTPQFMHDTLYMNEECELQLYAVRAD